jgi:hypothetical protein
MWFVGWGLIWFAGRRAALVRDEVGAVGPDARSVRWSRGSFGSLVERVIQAIGRDVHLAGGEADLLNREADS